MKCVCERENVMLCPSLLDFKGQGLPDCDSLTPISEVFDFYILLSCIALLLVFDDVIMHLVSETCQSFTFVAS